LFIKTVKHSEKGRKYYPHESRVTTVLTLLNYLIINVMSTFITYALTHM